MSDTQKFDLHYTGVYLQAANCALVSSETAELSGKNIAHTYVYLFFDGKWYTLERWPNAIVGMCHLGTDSIQLFFLCANGKVYKRVKGVITEEIIDPSDEGPSDLLLMRNMIAVGEELIAVGMARRAYRRSQGGEWSAIDATCFVSRKDRTSATGFNAVAAAGGTLIAVGHKGEIWRFDGQQWSMEESRPNVTLTGVSATDEGDFVIVGLDGVIMRGAPGSWRTIDHGATTQNFWGVVLFQDRMYVSNYGGVFCLNDSALETVTIEPDREISTAYLSATRDAIWSVGVQDIYTSSDGVMWTRVENP
ncbi:MAG TPA: hypothetical protein VFV58_34215 [Blastocatellia bacterium]|jgi:hypothetical protein|nr:hypothetical protein [Blastocatellia bacterium]